jgi:uncharacterized protein (TIGR02266 family)
MEGTKRTAKAAIGVEESRGLLQAVLHRLQEREEASPTAKKRAVEITEAIADAMGELYRASKSETGSTQHSNRAFQILLRTLDRMDALPSAVAEKQQLAVLFAVGAGPRSSCPPPRRSSTSMKAVRVSPSVSPGRSPSSPHIEVGEVSESELHALGLTLDDFSDSPPESSRTTPDRRTRPRIAYEVEVGLVSESHFYAGLSMDVSTGGLFIATYQLQPVGSRIAVTFALPSGHTVTTHATVRWVREPCEESSPGMGVEFDLPRDDHREVEAFCKRRQPLFIDMD